MGIIGKYILVCFLVLWLGASPAWARPTDEHEARRSVAGWLALDHRPLKARLGAKTGRVHAYKDSAGNIAYFVVHLEAGGFVVIAGDGQARQQGRKFIPQGLNRRALENGKGCSTLINPRPLYFPACPASQTCGWSPWSSPGGARRAKASCTAIITTRRIIIWPAAWRRHWPKFCATIPCLLAPWG